MKGPHRALGALPATHLAKSLALVDALFDLFTRAWCVAELAKAHAMGMVQEVKLLNKTGVKMAARKLVWHITGTFQVKKESGDPYFEVI